MSTFALFFEGARLEVDASADLSELAALVHSITGVAEDEQCLFLEGAAASPLTAAALAAMPCRMTGVPFAYAFFSRMGPGCEIAPHFGPTNLRVRVHVPVRVPAGGAAVAGLRVGGETRGYDVGRALVFDDAFEHSAWNKSPTAERDVLLFDLWHPELSPGDIASVQRLFGEAREKGWIK